MGSNFDAIFAATYWPNTLAVFGETLTHEPIVGDAYNLTLIFDDGSIVEQKGGKVAAALKGPKSGFVAAPAERDLFVRGGVDYLCVEVDDDKAGGYICWVRRKS